MASAHYDSFGPHPSASEGPDTPFEQLQDAINTDANVNSNAIVNADLSYRHNPRGHSLNNPPPNGWVYPHKKGIGTGSNLENFKSEIEQMTQKGENCKAIAEALNALGVQTSDRAVSRVRIKWGMRKRAQRKVRTPPPGSEAARLSAKSRVQALRKSELIRMTKEGMSAEEIYQNLTERGMELKKGIATILRLQSAWGLAHDEKRWLGNFRHQCHKKARAQQLEAFKDIAKDLGIQDIEVWLPEKMGEEAARQARHELALKLMGEHAPTNPERRKLQNPRRSDGPYARRASESATSYFDADSDADSPTPAKQLMSDIDPSGVSTDQQSYLGDMGLELNEVYAPLNIQRENDIYDAEGDDEADGAAIGADHGPELVEQTLSQPTTASRLVPMGDHIADPPMDLSKPSLTLGKRGKGRPPHQYTAKPVSIPAFEAPSSLLQTNLSPIPRSPTRSVISHIPTAGLATTSATSAASSAVIAAATIASPTPLLVVRAEEVDANRSTISALDQYIAASKVYKELLEARTENKPLCGSLTGLPPPAKEVDTAKRKLKEATQAMMLALD